MTDQRRRFNGTERAVLYLAADGHCEACGAELAPGWHADHVQPHSRQGATDVINGQALCPPCNLKKGNSVTNPRAWQQQARDKFFAAQKQDFLVSATPGAGKTRFSLTLASELMRTGAVRRVVVVVPTDALRQQWADQAGTAGLALMPVSEPDDYDKAGYQGCVVTYAQIARGAGSGLMRRATRLPTLAILDEVHHAGENRSWGDGLTSALENASVRLALTGTPWRRDGKSPIPFVTYDANGEVIVDYPYEYGQAVADGVCRPIEFHAYDGEARWVDCGKVEKRELGSDLDDDEVSAALDAALHPGHSWMPTLLREADRALGELRTEIPDAGGLVVADSVTYAYEYASLLAQISGTEPTVVVSKDQGGAIDPEAKAKLDRYKAGTSPWLVAVRMVSEGVDIPRLAVGVYATKYRTPLFFRQVVGRFVRVRPDEDFNARLYIPAISALMGHAREIEKELRHQLELEREQDEREQKERDGEEQQALSFREPLSASESVFDRAIFGGEDVTPEELEAARDWCRRHNIPVTFATNVARGRREESASSCVQAEVLRPRPVTEEPRHRRERVLRGEVNKLAGKVSYRAGLEKREVNARLLRDGYPPRSKASVEQLEQMRDYLARWLGAL